MTWCLARSSWPSACFSVPTTAGAEPLQEDGRRLELAGMIMVAGDDDARQPGPARVDAVHGAVEHAARIGARRHAVENVTGDDQRIDLPFDDDALDLGQCRRMLVAPRPPIESAPDMPVAGVEDPQHSPWEIWPIPDSRATICAGVSAAYHES